MNWVSEFSKGFLGCLLLGILLFGGAVAGQVVVDVEADGATGGGEHGLKIEGIALPGEKGILLVDSSAHHYTYFFIITGEHFREGVMKVQSTFLEKEGVKRINMIEDGRATGKFWVTTRRDFEVGMIREIVQFGGMRMLSE